MSKFDEPYFKRSYGGKDVFLSLWGPEGKRKWRIGPDVNTKGELFKFLTAHIQTFGLSAFFARERQLLLKISPTLVH